MFVYTIVKLLGFQNYFIFINILKQVLIANKHIYIYIYIVKLIDQRDDTLKKL